MDLELSTHPYDGWSVVTVVGELDLETASQLGDHALESVRDDSPHLALDMSGVTFMDSTGLKVLLAVQTRVQVAQGWLALVGATRAVRRILELTGLDQTFALHDSVEELPPVSDGAAPTT